MSTLSNKIDFAVVMTVRKANPNGDPLNGNRPREDFDGFGEISDVCIKRKLRNRLQDMGERIFVQSSDRCDDGAKSLHDRASNTESLKKAGKDSVKFAAAACAEWIDVRAFGQVFAFKGDSVSIGVRGPVSIRTAETITPIDISTMQITKSVNGETGLYVCYGSINPQLAEKTGFSEEDAQKIKTALTTLFENDASSARPEGSMEVRNVYWWKHNCKSGQYSSAKVHRSLKIRLKDGMEQSRSYDDYDIQIEPLEGLAPEELSEECR